MTTDLLVPHCECVGDFVPRERGRARASARVIFFSPSEYVLLYPYADVSVDVKKSSDSLCVVFLVSPRYIFVMKELLPAGESFA